ncbi:MAG: radical SAM protein [Promethearchaeota archaeon]
MVIVTADPEILKETTSLCPECLQPVPATIFVDHGGTGFVMMRKECPEHGEYRDKLASHPEYYKWNMRFAEELGSTVGHSTQYDRTCARRKRKGCPYDCGPCRNHKSAPCICIIDVTNRCNLMCPVCFANANKVGYVVEPPFEDIVHVMEVFRSKKPVPPVLLQLSGGEPTLRADLPEIIQKGKELGFTEVMLTTNGVKLAKSVEYFRTLVEAGMDAVYLQFDGLEPDTWRKTRAVDLSKLKRRVIENARKVGFKGIMLVPTIVKGVNDHEVGNILDFALENWDVISGVVFQPVSICGRITYEDLMEMRYTTSDLQDAIRRHTGGRIGKFYPLATTAKLTRLWAWFDDVPEFSMLSHEDCGFATISVVDKDEDGNWAYHPIEDYFDVEGLIRWSNKVYDQVVNRELPKISAVVPVKVLGKLGQVVAEFSDKMTETAYRQAMKAYYLAGAVRYVRHPFDFLKSGTIQDFAKIVLYPSLETAANFLQNRNMFIGCMHFQDAYDFDLERVSHCLVHYGLMDPDDPDHERVLDIPFCAHNTIHRERLEKALARLYAEDLEVNPEQVQREIEELVAKID